MKKVEGCFCAYGVSEYMGKVMGRGTATGTGREGGGWRRRQEGGVEKEGRWLCGAEQGGEFTCPVWESETAEKMSDGSRTGHARETKRSTANCKASLRMSSTPKMFSLTVDDDDPEDSDLRHSVPFPSSASPPSSPPLRPIAVRTASTPVLLSNGKPLKSSLKSSSSAPHIALPPLHLRARSAPATPVLEHIPKNVRFPTDELATVRTFSRSARPASLLVRPAGDDTETETDGELSGAPAILRAASAVAVPRSPLAARWEIDAEQSSPVPMKNIPPHANALLETIAYAPRSANGAPHRLSGTLLVRNLAYEKMVAVRFTLDDWQTTSEVSARHLTSLHAFPLSYLVPNSQPVHPTAPQWDRFGFTIRLEDYAANLAKRTLFLVARYIAHPSSGPLESWDNNSGQNYKVVFKDTSPTRPRGLTLSSPRASFLFCFLPSCSSSFQPLLLPS